LTLIVRMGQGVCCYYFWLGRQPIPRLWMAATNHHLGYPRCTAKHCGHYVDAHYQNWAVTMSVTLLPRKAASTLVMDRSDQVTFQWLYFQDYKWLTLLWHSFSRWGTDGVAIIFAPEGSHYLIFEWLHPITTSVAQDAEPKSFDVTLTLIFRIGQWPCRLLLCQEWLPVCWFWIAVTKWLFNYHTYKTKNRWHSIDAHSNVLSSQDLLPLIIAFIIIWT